MLNSWLMQQSYLRYCTLTKPQFSGCSDIRIFVPMKTVLCNVTRPVCRDRLQYRYTLLQSRAISLVSSPQAGCQHSAVGFPLYFKISAKFISSFICVINSKLAFPYDFIHHLSYYNYFVRRMKHLYKLFYFFK